MSSRAGSRTARAAERRAGAAAALLAAAALGLGACGSDGQEPAGSGSGREGEIVDISGTEAVGEMIGGSVAQLAECRDWNGASDEQKLATIEDIRSQVNRPDAGIDTPALTDEEALAMFDSSCRPAWAQGFRLYKLYVRAAGFVPLKRALED